MRGGIRFDRIGMGPLGKRHFEFRSYALLASLVALVGLLAVLALSASTATAAECTNTWTGPSEGSWKKVANWSAGHAPSSTDVACIGSGSTVKVNEASGEAAVVQGEGSILLWAYTLNLTSASEASSIGSLSLTGNGTLKGAGTLKISGTLSWPEAGTMSGSGSLVILPGATASVTLSGIGTLTQRDLVNEGTFTLASGTLSGSEGAEIVNKGTFNANAQTIAVMGAPVINTGTFRKTSGTGTSEVTSSFENQGAVSAQTGTIKLSGGGVSEGPSAWEAAKGAEIKLTKGPYTIKGGSLSGPIGISNSSGTTTTISEGVEAKSAELALSTSAKLSISGGSLTVTSLSFAGNSTLTGAGNLKISGTLSWPEAGTMSGSGSLVILPGATASVTLSGSGTLAQRDLVNEGTFTLSSGTLVGSEGAEIVNKGTFNANAQTIAVMGLPTVNSGTFRKTSGTGTSEITSSIENLSAVSAQTGKLTFSGGGSSGKSSSWEASEGAEVKLVKGPYSINGGSLSGTIGISKSATPATVTAEGVEAKAAEVTLGSSATLNLPSGTTTVKSISLTGNSTVKGAGDLNISGNLSWPEAGTISGTGSLVILPGATASISLSGTATLTQRRLVNEGTFTLSSGTLSGSEGAEVRNKGTFNANAQTVAILGVPIINTGTFRKTAGTGTSEVGSYFENLGTVVAQSGALGFTGSGISEAAAWEASEGAEVKFIKGSYLLSGGSLSGAIGVTGSIGSATVTTAGTKAEAAKLSVSTSGTLSVLSGAMTATSLTLNTGNVKGAGTLNVSSKLNWAGEGAMSGPGSTVVLPGATAITSFAGTGQLEQRRLVNEGTFTMSPGTISESAGAEIVNAGTFNVNAQAIAIAKGSGSSLFINKGTLKKVSGAGTTNVEPNFENHGTIKEESGKLAIKNPVTVGYAQQFGKRCHSGDPVECATGNYTETQTDFAIGGLGVGLELTRTYNARAAAAAASPDAFGYGWTNSFGERLVSEEGGKKITLLTGSGGSVPFTGGPGAFTSPAWSQLSLSGSAEAGYTLTLPDQTKYKFSGTGRLESATDRNGNKTTLAYDEAGRLKTITDPASRQIAFTYNGEGLVESAKDPMGHVVKYAYESKNLKSVTLPGEASPRWQFKYDGSHRITSVTDGRGGKTTNEYDGSSRVISQTDPAGHTLTFEYAPFHTKITNKATGSITDEWFTSNNEPLSVTRGYGTADATTETFSYDSGGRLVAATDGKGHTTTYGYNAQGDRTSEKDAEGNEEKWAYNSTHDLISTTTPGGETTTIERDANGNVESISRPAPEETTQTTSFEYDEDGQLESITDPLERIWTYTYSPQGDRISEADPLGNAQTLGYDGDSRLTSIVTPRGNAEGAEAAEFETTIERDSLGRPLKATDPLGGSVKYAYDANGNLESKTNPNGHTINYAYDADNQQTKVEKPNGAVLETEYDGESNVTSQTDANKDMTTYVRNALGQPVEVIDPLGRKTIEHFDAAGNLKATIDAAERETSYAYDKADRIIEVDYSEGATPDAEFEYDQDGNVTKMVDGTGESTFAYDEFSRLRESEDGHGNLVGYGYNLGEELTAIAYPNGKGISRTFDKAGRLENVTDWLGGTTAFSYDPDSNLEAITFPAASANVDEYAYDNAGRMSATKFTSGPETLASLSYLRDSAGQIEEEAASGLPGPATRSYGYDQNERLVEAGEASFEYDPADNLTEAPGTVNAYDPASQLETGTGVSYSYDKFGERMETAPEAGPATAYGYDQAGNLTSIERPEEGELPSISQGLAYDATGLLASKTSGLATHYMAWDSSSSLPLLLSDGENSYIYGPNGLPIEQISAEEPSYLHHDQLGSTRILTDSAGEEIGAFSYAPFGGLEASIGTASTPLGFAGQYTDSESGLQYLRARFYDPVTAQFLTKDPLTAVLRTPYGYANENPLRYVDPSGMSCVGVDHYGPGIPFPTVDPVDCASDLGDGAGAAAGAGGDAAGFAVDQASLLIPPIVFAACLVEENWCTPAIVGGAAAGVGANGIKASEDPCFNFWSASIRDLLVNIAAALPGGVFAATAGRAGPELTPIARRILQVILDAPGLGAELVHGSTG